MLGIRFVTTILIFMTFGFGSSIDKGQYNLKFGTYEGYKFPMSKTFTLTSSNQYEILMNQKETCMHTIYGISLDIFLDKMNTSNIRSIEISLSEGVDILFTYNHVNKKYLEILINYISHMFSFSFHYKDVHLSQLDTRILASFPQESFSNENLIAVASLFPDNIVIANVTLQDLLQTKLQEFHVSFKISSGVIHNMASVVFYMKPKRYHELRYELNSHKYLNKEIDSSDINLPIFSVGDTDGSIEITKIKDRLGIDSKDNISVMIRNRIGRTVNAVLIEPISKFTTVKTTSCTNFTLNKSRLRCNLVLKKENIIHIWYTLDKHLVHIDEYPVDASRGIDLPKTLLFLNKKVYTSNNVIVNLPLPDFSMPYNVIALTSSTFMFFISSIIKIGMTTIIRTS